MLNFNPLTYIKFKLYKRFQKRFVPRETKILNYRIHYNDPKSLFSEYKILFKNQAYHFNSPKKSPFIIDGGGHIGLSTLYFKHLYPSAKVLIFEPDLESLLLLKKNLSANSIKDVEIIESGLYSHDDILNFSGDNSDGGRISERGSNRIRVERLSNYINSELDFLKLNIEGAELEVFKDIEKTDKLRHINELCIEWHSFAHQDQNLGQILSILENNNFKYIINHFDYKINKVLRPPFQVFNKTQYYLLVYAKRKNLL